MRRRATSQSGAPTGRPRPRRPAPAGVPLRERLGWMLALLAVLGALVWVLWPALSLVFASAVFAYALAPVVRKLEQRGMRRERAIGALFGLILLAAVLAVGIVVPAVALQFQELSGNIDRYVANISAEIGPWAAWIEERTGVRVPLDFAALQAELPGWVAKLSPDALQTIQGTLTNLFSSGLGFLIGLFNAVLVPLFTFYLLRDWDRLIAAVDDMVPHNQRVRVRRVFSRIDERLSAFIRGQITLCLLLGLLYGAGLWIARIDLPFVIGLTAGVLFIVPYFGTVVGIVLASLLALLKYGIDAHVLYVFVVFGGAQLIEGWVLTPLLVGDKVGLHPMVVMVALIAFGGLLGIWGLLFAIPVAATLHVLLMEGVEAYRQSAFYLERERA